MPTRGKKYREAAKLIDREKAYSPEEAMELVKKVSYTNFDATVEVHLRMGLDPRHADQQVRSTVSLPHGTGKQVRVLVFVEGEGEKIAEEAGADYVGSDDLIQKIQGGWFEFDVAVATPPMMGKVGRMGKVLGPRGLMPSPKAGTIVPAEDLGRVVRELKAGRVEFRLDKTANIHVPIGKVSFSQQQLAENFAALMEAVQRAKPAAAKGQYIRRVTIAPAMGPGVKLDVFQASQLETV
ncbi:MAG: 50S ribosomal protein L1 [Anaerolineales bacterium]|nr:MAG: 50S ribosomal protein L1 [Anaerolineales bacterium]